MGNDKETHVIEQVQDNTYNTKLAEEGRARAAFDNILQNNVETNYIKEFENKINLNFNGFKSLIWNKRIEHVIKGKSNEIFNLIVNNELIQEWINEACKNKVDEYLSKEMKHFNVLVIGKTGTGKSTLCNEILKLPPNFKAEEGLGDPITFETRSYESNSVPGLRIFDTRGIELNGYNIDSLNEEINRIVEESIQSGNIDNILHCIWYTITGTRLEEVEIDLIKNLKNIYNDNNLPIIIIYTLDYFIEDSEEMKQFINETFQNERIEMISVVARGNPELGVMQKGLDTLIEYSVEKIKNSLESNFFNLIKNEIIKQAKDFNDKEKNYVTTLEERLKNIGNLKLENFEEQLLVNFNEALKLFTQNEENINGNDIVSNLAKELVSHMIEIITNNYLPEINKFKEEENDNLSKQYIDSQYDCKRIYPSLITYDDTYFIEKSKNKINELIEKYGENVCLKASLNFFCRKLFKNILEQINIIYERKINDVDLSVQVQERVNILSENIKNIILNHLNN